jgi:FkbM family methyltransferase
VDSAPNAGLASAFDAYRTAPIGRLTVNAFLGVPVVIYGAGNVGRDAARVLSAHGSQVIGFLDRRVREGAIVDDLPVWSPNANAVWPHEAIAVIAIFNPGVDVEAIRVQLERSGFAKVYTFLDLHDAFAEALGDRYWLTHRARYTDWEAAAISCEDLWADDESRHVYSSLLRFRLSHDYRDLPALSGGIQYFPEVKERSQRPLRLIDCGAFDGDTLRDVSRFGGAEAVAAFEPDLLNYRKLAECCRTLPNLGEVTLFPCAVASESGQARFDAEGRTASSLSDQGSDIVTCVALDDALPTFRPSMVKMDIEGAELSALDGARRLVEEQRPELAICVYHVPEHLWQIPRLVLSWYGDSARYYLRVYAHNGFETVFHAIPR